MFNSEVNPEKLNKLIEGSLSERLGIKYTEVGETYIKATMPVDHRTKQPFGYMHGGASAALAEELGSMAANMAIDRTKFFAFGLEINANHIKSVKDGFVTGVASPIHVGKSTHVWEIKIYNSNMELACISRLTMAIVSKR